MPNYSVGFMWWSALERALAGAIFLSGVEIKPSLFQTNDKRLVVASSSER